MEDLPDMIGGRWGHGCAGYKRGSDQVCMKHNRSVLYNIDIQVFLVVGGFSNGNLDSTELFISGEWTTVGSLPAAMRPWGWLLLPTLCISQVIKLSNL